MTESRYLDINGKWRTKPRGWIPNGGDCADCGMPVFKHEYHPHTACVLFRDTHNSGMTRASLYAAVQFADDTVEHRPTPPDER